MKEEAISNLRRLLGPNSVLLPIPSKSKAPRFHGWQNTSLEDTEASKYENRLRTHGNTGVLLGEPSDGLCSIDIDDNDALREFLELNPKLEETLLTKGQRGGNIWIRILGSYPVLTKLKTEGQPWGEWRATGGQTVVAGIHPSGAHYTFLRENQVIEVGFSDIRWPERLKGSNGRAFPRDYLTENTENAAHHAAPAATAPSVPLHGTPISNVAKATMAFEAIDDFEEADPFLARSYERFIENVYRPTQGSRNSHLIQMVTFLFYGFGPKQVMLLATQFYDRNGPIWRDPRKQHISEADCHLKMLLNSYSNTLPAEEKEFYQGRTNEEQSTFRICRDLASCESGQMPKGQFFLSANQLASRIGIDQKQAYRILKRFCSGGVMEVVEAGNRREKGEQGKATVYRWSFSPPNEKNIKP